MYEYLFQRHIEKISYIERQLKRRRASAVFDGADGLSGHAQLFDQISLPYLFFLSYLFQPVFHICRYLSRIKLYLVPIIRILQHDVKIALHIY